ncbi:MAG: hypothetical protein M9894_02660 [Planctomycetes bacterium]|nr:hypothetical protein [Planctomycetota bacterium]
MDDRLQDLRRRANQGEPGARTALLGERLRAGDLRRERLDLAAYVGDEDARAVLDPAFPPPVDLGLWARGLARWGLEAVLRAGLAASRSAFREEEVKDHLHGLAQDWILCPCDEHTRRLAMIVHLARLDDLAAELVTASVASAAAPRRVHGLSAPRTWNPAGESRVREALRSEVAPWALGERDPVRERVEAGG